MAHLRGLRRWDSELAAIEEEETLLDEDNDDFQMPTCRLCIEKAKRPVLLSCGHVFCWSCIVIATGHNRVCPRCKLPHSIGPEVRHEGTERCIAGMNLETVVHSQENQERTVSDWRDGTTVPLIAWQRTWCADR